MLRALVNKKNNNELDFDEESKNIEDFKNNSFFGDEEVSQQKKNKIRDARVITVTSGKGGVGKTNFTSNLAIALRRQGHRVVIVDADLSLGNVDVVMGVVSRANVSSVLTTGSSILDVIMSGPEGVDIVSGGSGITDLIDLDQNDLENIVESFKALNKIYDYK